jgi:putative transposase
MPRPTHPYVPTEEGWLYLAAVLDVFSRHVVGWAMDARLGSQLVLAALQMAYAQRCPEKVIVRPAKAGAFCGS